MTDGATISIQNGKLQVPDHPIIPFIEGDGTGPDIWRASVRVFDAAVAKAYGGRRAIVWKEVLAGQRSYDATKNWLPDETVDAFKQYLVGIKGPLTTPVGGGMRSLNVALAAIARPVRLPASGALVQGGAVPGQDARKGRHGDLPREHRRHLCRHRVGGGVGRRQESARLSETGIPQGVREHPLPRHDGHRHQAGLERRDRAARPLAPSSTRSPSSAEA